jgi:leader peptidase (prepilin peptidase)/N-methyltransferase
VDVVSWALAAAVAGLLGALGPRVIAQLPDSLDADDDAPDFQTIAGAKLLSLWLAVGAIALVSVAAVRVPDHLLPAWVILCGAGVWLAYVDGRTRILPTAIIRPLYIALLAVVAAEAWAADDPWVFERALIASAGSFAVYWAFWWIAGRRSPGSFGFGDVRFSAPLGLVLGTVGVWTAPVGIYLGFVVGGVAGLILKARGKGSGFALGPWMLVGAVLGPFFAA